MRLLVTTQKMNKEDPILGFFHAWVLEIARYCEEVFVVCLEEGVHDLPDNVSVYSLGKESGAGRLTYLWRFFKYIIAKRRDYDAVFVHMNPEYVVLGGLLWRLWGKMVGLWYVHKSVTLKLRSAEKLAHIIFTASKESFRLASPKVRVIGHGIDVASFAEVGQKNNAVFTIVTVGRFAASKGIQTILDAVSRLTVPFELTVVGGAVTQDDRVYEEETREYARNLGVADSVIFKGDIEPADVPDVLARADVFVSASKTGSIDKAVLEAMASGTPVVAPSGAYAGLLPEKTVYEDGNVRALAERLRMIEQMSPEERLDLGKRLQETVRLSHSVENLIPRILKEYEHR